MADIVVLEVELKNQIVLRESGGKLIEEITGQYQTVVSVHDNPRLKDSESIYVGSNYSHVHSKLLSYGFELIGSEKLTETLTRYTYKRKNFLFQVFDTLKHFWK